MIVANIKNDDEYFYNVLEFFVERDKELLTPKQFKNLSGINNYLYFLKALPRKEQSYVIGKLIQSIIDYNYDTKHKRYQNVDLNNGNSPSTQIKRDTKKILEYEELLKKLYSDYILFSKDENKTYLVDAPQGLAEHFYFIGQLKENMKDRNKIEGKNYFKPLKPTKKQFKQDLIEVREYYKITISDSDIDDFIREVI